MRVILNADDYGHTREANEGIRLSFEQGYCTQASLMTNFGEITDEAVAMAKDHGFDDRLGLHINLTAGLPLSEEMRNLPLYVHNGSFINPHSPMYKSKIHKVLPLHISTLRDEMRKQIEKYLSYDLTMMHCDCHYSIQQDLPVWIALCPLLKEYGFKTFRGLLYKISYSRPFQFYTGLLDLSYSFFHGPRADIAVNVKGFKKYSQKKDLRNSVVELYSHPVCKDGVLIDNYTYGMRMHETIGQFLQDHKDSIDIITYKDLL